MNVLKPWVETLTLQMQGTLLCAMRGPDGVPREDACKPLVRAFRAVVTRNAKKLGPDNPFAGDGTGVANAHQCASFFNSSDQYNVHWLTHFMHGAEVIGYKHPDHNIRGFWFMVYESLCSVLHVNMETDAQMTRRLGADGDC